MVSLIPIGWIVIYPLDRVIVLSNGTVTHTNIAKSKSGALNKATHCMPLKSLSVSPYLLNSKNNAPSLLFKTLLIGTETVSCCLFQRWKRIET